MKQFSGKLEWINPEYLVNNKEHRRIESFFIALGVVFNDLKGLLLFHELVGGNYEKPRGEVSCHDGEYAGMLIHVQRLIASTINEFFIFLKKNSDVFSASEFKELLERLPKDNRLLWDGMILAANNKHAGVEDLLKTLVQVRSNITFHYDHSGKILRNAFLSYFFRKNKDPKSKLAYFSIGNNIETTRFYFSDAAAEESMWIAAGKKIGETSLNDASIIKFQNQLKRTVEAVAYTITLLIKNYIQMRRNKPRS